eukprot:6794172-Ditylum_brightwellii.AAC.1
MDLRKKEQEVVCEDNDDNGKPPTVIDKYSPGACQQPQRNMLVKITPWLYFAGLCVGAKIASNFHCYAWS